MIYATAEKGICWNSEQKSLMVRRCNHLDQKWYPANVTCTTSANRNRFCPEDLIELRISPTTNKFICLKISEQPDVFEERFCYGASAIPTIANELEPEEQKSLIKYLNEKNVKTFWLPMKKAFENKYNPYVVKLPGRHYGTVYDLPLTLTELQADKHCLSATVAEDGTLQSAVTNCSDTLHSVCIFKRYFVTYSGCPQHFKALSYRPAECIGIDWVSGDFPNILEKLTMQEYIHNRNSIQYILETDELNEEDDRYFTFRDDNTAREYVIIMNLKEEVRLVKPHSIRNNKKIAALSKEVLRNKKNVEMTLKMDGELDKLILTVYNRNYVWRLTDKDKDNYGIKCFTNADNEIVKTVKIKLLWQNECETKSMFEVKLDGDGPGYYWCEAHTIFDFALVSTPRVVATDERRGHTFAMDYIIEAGDRELQDLHNDQNRNRNSRNFTDNRNNITGTIKCLCHVTVSKKSSGVDKSYEVSSEEDDSKEKGGIRHDTLIRMELYELLRTLVEHRGVKIAGTVKSTEYCFPETFRMNNSAENQWLLAQLDQTVTTQQLCLQQNGLPVTRKCQGNFLYGATWEDAAQKNLLCIDQKDTITQNLYQLVAKKVPKKTPVKAVENVKTLLERNIDNLIPADFYYMAKIMQGTVKSIFSNNTTSNVTHGVKHINKTTSDIVQIYNYLMEVKESVIKPSIVLNSTNILLDSFEHLLDHLSLAEDNNGLDLYNLTDASTLGNQDISPTVMNKFEEMFQNRLIEDNDKFVETIEYEDVGVVVKMATNFVFFVIDPKIANVTGIALFNILEDNVEVDYDVLEFRMRGAFRNEYYNFILADQNVDELLYAPDLQMATYVPELLLTRLDEISTFSNNTTTRRPEPRIVIKLYANSILFQEDEETVKSDNRKVFGKIISISIPGHDKDLPAMLPLYLKVDTNLNESSAERYCNYWNYKTWANDGISFLGHSKLNNNIILCATTHLTPFAYLIGGGYHFADESKVVIENTPHEEALDIISILGCSLSLFGILGIAITAGTFQSWRQKASSKVLLQLCAAIALQMILFCFINTEEKTSQLLENQIFSSCIAIGAFLHYSVLVQFCWMVIIAYLQFKRYVQVFGNTRPKRFFIKSAILAWGVPLIPVLIVLLVDRSTVWSGEEDVNGPEILEIENNNAAETWLLIFLA
ncbi:uncharacterized protein LOC119666481 [Teleopsis dalmanni]|uniref:uncharacterized protein LOC119666481 n=1 Tax=Teleopsis dalmanni TaxID=139649 RepID=UPI0018CED070|nr:uncharacterized protein LOC119666481 [Teleopsis dalmanni]